MLGGLIFHHANWLSTIGLKTYVKQHCLKNTHDIIYLN
ncbi:hypothetical protein GNIT_0563 [Glaciecola nitratireducens FR1064]|uniref:Uncharacterized protein n=1 Tax=Glaciecola nitratireducens (strain JCM 12485 / KCTC 12276 / FR1064) TaxID=1085623 RepID=G4QJQ7_GLANF|nr:hypothetical protein GNIT_0563 [Glaciecola nitratireducens FR1064]